MTITKIELAANLAKADRFADLLRSQGLVMSNVGREFRKLLNLAIESNSSEDWAAVNNYINVQTC